MNSQDHLRSADDLVTPYEETRAGFIKLALEKNRQATPYIEEAKALKVAASRAPSPADLIHLDELRPAILTAAGISDKATGHLRENDKLEAIRGLIEAFLEPAGRDFVIERAMASEIFSQLETGSLANAANLTRDEQLFSLCSWLVRL